MNRRKITDHMISLMARQSLSASRMRNLFVMITIVLASSLVTAILMFAAGQDQRIKKALSRQHQVAYYNLTAEQAAVLTEDPRIAVSVQTKTGVPSKMDGFDLMPYYVSALSEQIQIGTLERGRLPEAENEIAAPVSLLKKMGAEPEVGSRVTFTFYDGQTETFVVSGILKDSREAKSFSVFFSRQYAESGSQLKDLSYEVYARLSQAESLSAEECRQLMLSIGSDAGIERKYTSPSKAFLDSRSVDTQSALVYGLIGLVILLACILVIYGVFYLSVLGRIHQFGQLRTIGMTKKQIRCFVSREGRRLYLRSAPIGMLLGIIAGAVMLPDGFSIVPTLWIVVLVAVAVYLITMLSVRKPARIAAAVSPMEALRYLPQDSLKRTASSKMCRRLTPLSLGIMNFSKNRKKAVITFVSLSLGGILFMTAATYIASFDKTNYARQGYFKDAEFHIYYAPSAIELSKNGLSGLQADAPLDESLLAKIAALDGVTGIREIKTFGVNFDHPNRDEYDNPDGVYALTDTETREISRYLAEGSADYEKLMSGDYILAAGNDTAKEIYGWEFAVGDQITLHYYDGAKIVEHNVSILGILNAQYTLDHDGLEGWFLMPEQAILSWLSYDSLNAHLVISTEPEKEEAIHEALKQMLTVRTELGLEALAERRIVYAQEANRQFAAISGLAIFIMMFSILSMINTLITNIVTRKQELAMLASIGMEKMQIRRMLLGENLLLVLVAVGVTVTIGTGCGYALCHRLNQIGAYYMAFRFPLAYTLAYAIALTLVPLAITLEIMHHFSKEPLVERLRGVEN